MGSEKSGNKMLVLSIRLAVLGVLVALVAVAGLDFMAKGDAEKTATAWREFLKENDIRETKLAAMEELQKGSPSESEGKRKGAYDVKIYTWKQKFPFRANLEIHVEYRKKSGIVNAIEPKW